MSSHEKEKVTSVKYAFTCYFARIVFNENRMLTPVTDQTQFSSLSGNRGDVQG